MNKSFYYSLLVAVALLCQPVKLSAQISEGGTPPSFQYQTRLRSGLAVTELPVTFSVDSLIREDERRLAEGVAPPTVATSIKVGLSAQNAGQWSRLPGGETIWQLHLHAHGAKALMVYYADFYLPKGGRLYLYNSEKTQLLGAYTQATHPQGGVFATEMVAGDELVFEYVAAPDGEMPRIEIASVGYVYNNVYTQNGEVSLRAALSEPCNVNVNCQEGAAWQDQKRGVCYMTQKIGDDTYICTGSLVNNTAGDLKPYIISAAHCSESSEQEASAKDMQQWLFYFHMEYEACSNASGIVPAKTMVGCEKIVKTSINGQSDGLLLLLNDSVPESYDVYYNGWDRRAAPAQQGVSIHHPSGDMKKISTFSAPLTSETFSNSRVTGETDAHWNATFVATANGHGVTEGGSSGSPLFNEHKLIVGTLTGGNSSCDYLDGMNLYGKLSSHWNRYTNTSATRMDMWLDPLSTGAEALEGRYHSAERVAFAVSLEAELQPNQAVLLSWAEPEEGNPVKYNVYRNDEKIAETEELFYLDKTPLPGTQRYDLSCTYANGSESNRITAVILVHDLRSPLNVAAAYTAPQQATLSWGAPLYEQTIYWGESEAAYQTMLGEAVPCYFGQQWGAEELRELHKKTITAVNFMPIEGNKYEIYIAQGADRVYTQEVANPAYSDVNKLALTTPFAIDATRDLIVAIYIAEHSQSDGYDELPMVTDAGPALPGKGNIYSYDGNDWGVLYRGQEGEDESYNFNFFVSATLSSQEGNIPALRHRAPRQSTAARLASPKVGVLRAKALPLSTPATLRSARPAAFPNVTGYVVYRNGAKLASTPALPLSYTDKAAEASSYYQVAALYDHTHEGKLSDSAFISLLSGVPANEDEVVMIYPAIFSAQVNIRSPYRVAQVEVYDTRGRLCLRVPQPELTLNTQSLPTGMYLFRLSTETGKSYVLRGVKW
ncbi:MAG: T9SS type A sorting domain-containing protein [Prevotellaceae bacterium]|jgi:hypothetical protein|nr:T9SS type A sorting domain-containing protein [Prevotellaceae bacterium]